MASRKLEDLNDDAREAFELFEGRLEEEGLDHFKRCCTYRSQAEQDVVYMQGRSTLEEVNAACAALGLSLLTEKENRRPVTWTHRSLHTSRDAVDYFISLDGKYITDLKVDVDDDGIPDWEEFGALAEECGLEWGGNWEKRDIPHVQFRREP